MGIFYITMASVLFGSNPSVQQVLLLSGMSPDLIALGTIVVGALLAGFTGVLRHESFRVTGHQMKTLFLAGIIGRGVTEICLVTAYTMIPAGVATMVHFFFPTLVSVAMVLLFHEKWTGRTGLAIVLSLAGLLGIAGGTSGSSLQGILVAALSSVSFGYYYILTERSDLKEIPPMVMIFYVHLFAAAANAVMVTARGEWVPVSGALQGAVLLASGLVGFAGYIFLNAGIPRIGAGIAAFINMLEPITSVMLSIVLFHSRLEFHTVIGCALIVGAMFVRAGEKR